MRAACASAVHRWRARTRRARRRTMARCCRWQRVETTYQLARKAHRPSGARSSRSSAREPVEAPLAYAELLRDGRLLPPLTHPDPGALPGERHGAHASRQRRGARFDAREDRQAGRRAHRLHEDVQVGRRRRQARGQQARHAARVVLQGQWPQRGRLRLTRSPRPTSPRITAKSPSSSGCYVIDENGRPRRLGFAIGNEFSDHVTERRNYLLLAHSKLRQCGVGPDAEHRRAARAPRRHEPHPPRRRRAVAEAVPHRRGEHVPHASPTSSTTTSSTSSIACRATCTCISSAPRR